MSMGKIMKLIFIVIGALLGLVACDSTTGPDGDAAMDYNQLLQGLRQSGLPAEPAGQLSQPFISVPARLIAIGGEQVQVFEYPDERSAQADAARISADGSVVGTSIITWVGPPHFYWRGRVLALYVGDRADIKTALERLLGSQFAGR
jgi:hypothetical protein